MHSSSTTTDTAIRSMWQPMYHVAPPLDIALLPRDEWLPLGFFLYFPFTVTRRRSCTMQQICQWLHQHRGEGCSWNAFDGAAAGAHMHVLCWLDEFYPSVGPSAVAFVKVCQQCRTKYVTSCTCLCTSSSVLAVFFLCPVCVAFCSLDTEPGGKNGKPSRALISFFSCSLTVFMACLLLTPAPYYPLYLTRGSGGESGKPARFAVVASALPWSG